MPNVNELKQCISDILLDTPVDITDEISGEIYYIPEWETFHPRQYVDIDTGELVETRKIGSVNVISVINYLWSECSSDKLKNKFPENKIYRAVQSIFGDFLIELEKEKIIRKSPEHRRREIKLVVDNTIEESIK